MPKLILSPGQETFPCQMGDTIMHALLEHALFIDNPCNGKGLCGKCRVRVLSGGVTPVTETEKSFLKEEDIRSGIRLSCMARITGDVTVALLKTESGHKVLSGGKIPAFTRDTVSSGKGVCIDIGTTTVVTSLIDLPTGKELASASDINAQKHFGLDVLTRITYEYEHPETGIKDLQNAIVTSLNKLIQSACQKAGVSSDDILKISVAANCTMMHTLLGVDARPIGRAPYRPVFLNSRLLPAREIGLDVSEKAMLYCLPQVSAFIGADIVAGVMVAGLHKNDKNVLFIDIGTNGEIVLATKGRLLTCSCAAGPALEGMNISSGMRASAGAIEDVQMTKAGITCKTIGDCAPQGLCGSGILSVLKELLRTGIVKPTGAFVKPDKLPDTDWRKPYIRMDGKKREFVLSTDPLLIVTQSDIRQVQLAKGAILSGFMALLKKARLSMDDLDAVVIAGQFGAHLPAASLVGTGILPPGVKDKITYIGNASKTGAYMTLLSQSVTRDMATIASKMEYMELAESEDYEQIFMEAMIFPKWDNPSTI